MSQPTGIDVAVQQTNQHLTHFKVWLLNWEAHAQRNEHIIVLQLNFLLVPHLHFPPLKVVTSQ